MKEKIDAVLSDVNKLPSISNVVIKVMEMVRDPAVSIQDLATEISKDPAITATIIKLSNSAYYRASKPIKTVQESLMTLGIKVVKEIILVTAAKGIFYKDVQGYQIEAEAMWLHSLIVAELSFRISQHKKLTLPKDLVFTAGLLHDVGKMIMAQFFPSVLFNIKNEVKDSKEPFTELEKKYFGYDHQEVGKKALEKWNFPEELIEVIAYHHNPEEAKKFPLLTAVVHIANTIAIVSGVGIDIGGISQPLSKVALQVTGVTEKDLQDYYLMIPDLEKSLAELKSI
ncbi:MAG: HDOD domain-containing protein [Leptospiraceae bacterium]|nr:HDOD domain-containing protein [Leptospiraceae bacterium]MCK6380905.1 HDOD domain-containing protein [Leptospiraceae bacterium]NUM40039.1 HDOD domain-containing protein [Leptospiraceae bacterium]